MVSNVTKVRSSIARILIVDKHPVTRDGITHRISGEGDLEVCGYAADIPDTYRLIEDTLPDLVLIDIGLSNGDALELVKRLKSRNSPVKFLVWSVNGDSLYAERALRAGALGYVSKEEPTETIISAIRRVLLGGIYLSPGMMDLLVRRNVAGLDKGLSAESLDDLSDRELAVFRMTGQGLDTYEIAGRMRVSPKTVETYKARIKDKLGLGTGSEVLVRAVRWVVENE
jgi:DNA-binding NarL/FixJ family response regulator